MTRDCADMRVKQYQKSASFACAVISTLILQASMIVLLQNEGQEPSNVFAYFHCCLAFLMRMFLPSPVQSQDQRTRVQSGLNMQPPQYLDCNV